MIRVEDGYRFDNLVLDDSLEVEEVFGGSVETAEPILDRGSVHNDNPEVPSRSEARYSVVETEVVVAELSFQESQGPCLGSPSLDDDREVDVRLRLVGLGNSRPIVKDSRHPRSRGQNVVQSLPRCPRRARQIREIASTWIRAACAHRGRSSNARSLHEGRVAPAARGLRVGLILPRDSSRRTRKMPPRYRVLSLDLHDTVVWDTPAIVDSQYEVRWTRLAEGLSDSGERPVSRDALRAAREALHSRLKSEGRPIESIPVAEQVERIREHLGAHYASPVEQVVQRYAEGGLKEHPPVFNPEAQDLVRHLNEVGFPVVVITDTSRPGSVWKSFLEAEGALHVAHVIASTDVGVCKPDVRIFTEAAKQAGVAPSVVLHVGDSWMWDVAGARGCGMGAALYRGLSAHAWDPEKLREGTDPKDPSVPCIDHLSEVTELLGLG